MGLNDQFRAVLEEGDVARCRRAWGEIAPHLPQPKSDAQAEIMMHHARTQAVSITFAKRAWSHRWLTERSLPTGLPDNLKPKAERMYPKVVEAVGIAVRSQYPGVAGAVRTAMENAVKECQADGVTDPIILSSHMQAARAREKRGLGLIVTA